MIIPPQTLTFSDFLLANCLRLILLEGKQPVNYARLKDAHNDWLVMNNVPLRYASPLTGALDQVQRWAYKAGAIGWVEPIRYKSFDPIILKLALIDDLKALRERFSHWSQYPVRVPWDQEILWANAQYAWLKEGETL